MLVLTRKKGEAIRVGDIKIVVVDAKRKSKQIKLGIDAPRSLPVHREEVYQAIRRNEAARTDAVEGTTSATEGLLNVG